MTAPMTPSRLITEHTIRVTLEYRVGLHEPVFQTFVDLSAKELEAAADKGWPEFIKSGPAYALLTKLLSTLIAGRNEVRP